MENVFKAITTIATDEEKTAVYQTVKHIYLFNLELLPVDLGLKILAYLDNEEELEPHIIKTISGNVEEFRAEYVITDDLETLKKKVAEV